MHLEVLTHVQSPSEFIFGEARHTTYTHTHTYLLPELSVNGRRLDGGVRLHVPGDGDVRQRVARRPHPPPEATRVFGLLDAGDLPQAGACGA